MNILKRTYLILPISLVNAKMSTCELFMGMDNFFFSFLSEAVVPLCVCVLGGGGVQQMKKENRGSLCLTRAE